MLELQPDLAFTTGQAERLLEASFGGPVVCSRLERLSGGLVNTVVLLEFDRAPYRVVVKLHRGAGHAFEAEARALEYLRTQTTCPVPRVYRTATTADVIPYAFLLLEYVPGRCLDGLRLEPAVRADIETQLADVLGELHHHRGHHWGRIADGGSSDSWVDTFTVRLREARAHPRVRERLEPRALEVVDRAIEVAPIVLSGSAVPTLVHGDVWDGNIIVRRDRGRWRLAALLDPDLQFADPEYELAYLEVFDARREAFISAYRRHHESRPGYEQRRLVYWLHTALVHVALFGDEFFRDFAVSTATAINRSAAP